MAVIVAAYAATKPVYVPLTAFVFLISDSSISESRRKSMIWKAVIFIAALVSCVAVQKHAFMSMEKV